MVDRSFSALVALCLAFLVWLYTRSRDQEMLDDVPIPVHVTLAPSQSSHYHVEIGGPSLVPVSFNGPPSSIRELRGMLQRGEIQVDWTLTVPEDRQDESRYLDTIRISAADVHVPPGVTASVVEGRNRIPVTLHRLAERRVPVRFDHSLEERVGKVTIEPATVLVRGPQEILDRTRSIATQPFILPESLPSSALGEEVTQALVPLVNELDGRSVQTAPGRVMVKLTVQPRHKVYELAEVPVQFLCPPNFPLRPKFIGDGRAGKISVQIRGPAQEETPVVLAYIDLTRGKFQQGLHEEPLRLQLPRDFELSQNPPRSVAFELQPAESGAGRTLGFLPESRPSPLEANPVGAPARGVGSGLPQSP